MKKLNQVVVALMAVGMLGGTVMPAVTASAASTGYSRAFIAKLSSTKYKVANTKGKTYKMTGSAKNVKLKTNHYLKNYKQNKWTRTKMTQIKHDGNWMVYYYVTPITKKKHVGGWVKLTDMKPMKTFKGSKYISPDYDTWYKNLSHSKRNQYYQIVRDGDITDPDGKLMPYPDNYFN